MKKVNQNDVGIFEAGFKAGFLMTDYFNIMTDYFNTDLKCYCNDESVVFGNIITSLLSEYRKGGFHDDGLEKMYEKIKSLYSIFELSDEEKKWIKNI